MVDKAMEEEDPFDAVINAEERLHQAGFDSGSKHGRMEGQVDGFSAGLIKGIEIGNELGFYLGFIEGLFNMEEQQENKLKRLMTSLLDEVKGFKCLELHSSSYIEDTERIRARFKQITSILKIKDLSTLRQSGKYSF